MKQNHNAIACPWIPLLDRHFKLYPVIAGVYEILLSSKIPLSRLDGRVTQQQLDLF